MYLGNMLASDGQCQNQVLYIYIYILVGGLEHFLCSTIYGIILPIDYYFSRWLKPPNCLLFFWGNSQQDFYQESTRRLLENAETTGVEQVNI